MVPQYTTQRPWNRSPRNPSSGTEDENVILCKFITSIIFFKFNFQLYSAAATLEWFPSLRPVQLASPSVLLIYNPYDRLDNSEVKISLL